MEKAKKRRTILTVCAVLLAVWVLLSAVDTAAVLNWKKPVFAVCLRGADDGGSGMYFGLGYWFRIRGNFMPDYPPEFEIRRGVTKAEGWVFGIPYLNRER